MGFEFRQELTPQEKRIKELEQQLEMHEDFLNDNGYGVLFDMYTDMRNGKLSKEDYDSFNGTTDYEVIE